MIRFRGKNRGSDENDGEDEDRERSNGGGEHDDCRWERIWSHPTVGSAERWVLLKENELFFKKIEKKMMNLGKFYFIFDDLLLGVSEYFTLIVVFNVWLIFPLKKRDLG